jgi:hypothetical protein
MYTAKETGYNDSELVSLRYSLEDLLAAEPISALSAFELLQSLPDICTLDIDMPFAPGSADAPSCSS